MTIVVTAVWVAYLAVLPFHRVWVLPWLGVKFQPPEVVFAALVCAAAALWRRGAMQWRFVLADAAAAAWAFANLLALTASSEPLHRHAINEALSAAYVVCLYFAVRIVATPPLLNRFGEWFAWAAAAPAALGVAGSLASYAGVANVFATTFASTAVPYLGNGARAHALTAGPQMLASILLMAIPLLVAARMQHGWRRRHVALLILLAFGLLATLSKTALCVVVSLTIMWWFAPAPAALPSSASARRPAWVPVVVTAIVTCVFVLGSHVLVLRETAVPGSSDAQLVAGAPIASFEWRGEPWVVMPTSYLFNKRASLLAILQGAASYPHAIGFITPHSTYFGAAAELGVAGLAALLFLLIAVALAIARLLASSSAHRWEAAAYAGVCSAFALEAISTDLLNCRHYWFLFAVIASRHAQVSSARQRRRGSARF
jgi:hypothetical protein